MVVGGIGAPLQILYYVRKWCDRVLFSFVLLTGFGLRSANAVAADQPGVSGQRDDDDAYTYSKMVAITAVQKPY